ncbi:MAG: hypothetical protein WAR21_01090 [Candidatus Acidiferrales bacterium]
MNISSKGKWPANVLSNFAAMPFVVDGVQCRSTFAHSWGKPLSLRVVVRERRVPRGQQRPFGAIALDEFSSKHTLDQTEVFFRTLPAAVFIRILYSVRAELQAETPRDGVIRSRSNS